PQTAPPPVTRESVPFTPTMAPTELPSTKPLDLTTTLPMNNTSGNLRRGIILAGGLESSAWCRAGRGRPATPKSVSGEDVTVNSLAPTLPLPGYLFRLIAA